MQLRGWVRTSLLDYPDRIASVVFTGGCNFRCPMCHNSDLVLRPATLPAVAESDVWDFLARRAGKVTGLVISGGEPTIQAGLCDFLRATRSRCGAQVAIKLDTNGACPAVLAEVLAEGLVDAVALDLKAPPEAYARLCGLSEAAGVVSGVARSLALLHTSPSVACEFRTTVVPGLLAEADLLALAHWLLDECHGAPAGTWYLQPFSGANPLDPTLRGVPPIPMPTLHAWADRLRATGAPCAVRAL